MLTAGPVPANSEGSPDIVGAITAALAKRFGGAAIQVARTQLALAASDTSAKWTEILSRLGG